MSTFYTQSPDVICHVGVLRRSGRYPWGSGKRPFQSGGGPTNTKKSKKQLAAEKAKATRAKNKAHEEEKQRVLREGNATEVLQFKSELTTKEMEDALKRIDVVSQLESFSKKEIKTYMNKIDDAMQGVKTATNWIKIGTDTYNTLAKLYNATEEGQKKPLTIIQGGGEGKDKKKK